MKKMLGLLLVVGLVLALAMPARALMFSYEDNDVKFTMKNEMNFVDDVTGKWTFKSYSIPTHGNLWVEVNFWRGPTETPFVHVIYNGEYVRRNGNIRQYKLECSNWNGSEVEATNSTHAGPGINPPERFRAITHCSVEVSDDSWVTPLPYGWGVAEVKAGWNELKDTMSGSVKFTGGSPYNEIFTFTFPFQLIREVLD